VFSDVSGVKPFTGEILRVTSSRLLDTELEIEVLLEVLLWVVNLGRLVLSEHWVVKRFIVFDDNGKVSSESEFCLADLFTSIFDSINNKIKVIKVRCIIYSMHINVKIKRMT